MGSTTGRIFRVTTFGESHGVALGCTIENIPAGLELSETDIQPELDRRRPGQSNLTTPRNEGDRVQIVSGVFEGRTIGSPVTLLVFNENAEGKDYSYFKDIYRPSHADYTYQMRYGHRSYVGGGRASARTTLATVAAGAVARKILQQKLGISLCAYVSQIYNLSLPEQYSLEPASQLKEKTEANDVRCPDQNLAAQMAKLIQKTRQEGDSLGGVVELLIEQVPAGLGDPVFDRLDAQLAAAMLAIPASKGVEIGSGFAGTLMKGSEHNDLFYNNHGKIRTRSNFSGGIQGGISNGEPIFMRIAFKPTPTISQEQKTVNAAGEEVLLKVKGRHDPCVLPRAVPIVEAAAALVLVDQWLLSKTANYNHL